jgi:hypothetical protein
VDQLQTANMQLESKIISLTDQLVAAEASGATTLSETQMQLDGYERVVAELNREKVSY